MCGKPIAEGESWNRDHLPPAAFFGSLLKQFLSLNLYWLYTHESCNSAYRQDEEYVIAALVGHAQTPAARAVMRDLRVAFEKGHKRGLLGMIIGGFGTVMGPRGEVTFEFDRHRVDRVAWKLARGVYYRELGVVLPEKRPGEIRFINPFEATEQIANIAWYPAVLASRPMGDDTYRKVFDYKWISEKNGDLRGHAIVMLLWNRIILIAMFHDPACGCPECARREAAAAAGGDAA